MTKRVRRKSNTGNTQLLPQYVEIPFEVPNGDFCIVMCPKYKSGSPATEKAKQTLAKLDRKGYKSMLSAFAQYLDGELFEVYIFFRQSKHLARPKPCIKNRKSSKVSP